MSLLDRAQHDADAEARSVAVRALAHHPTAEVYDCLIRSLEDSNPCVRVNAIVALGHRGDLRAYPLLNHRVHDAHPEVRARAHEVLCVGGKGLLPIYYFVHQLDNNLSARSFETT